LRPNTLAFCVMAPETADAVITDFLKEIARLLDEAVSTAKAAEACAASGNPKRAVDIAMDTEGLVFQATTLLNAAKLVHHRDDHDS
jgi:hypothetical protein